MSSIDFLLLCPAVIRHLAFISPLSFGALLNETTLPSYFSESSLLLFYL
jgi:hypothetical protein